MQPYTDTAEDAAAAAFTITPPATSPPSSTTKPRITVACTPDPVRAGTSVTCTVTVTNPTAGGTARPAGSVRIGMGAADDPACTLGAVGTGAASCRVTFAVPTPGTATITARYAGDGTFAAGTASTTELVQADPATVSGVSTSGTTAALVATCPSGGGACRLDASMTTAAPTRRSPRVFARPAKTVTVGSAHASIAAGHRATLHVKLDRAGRRLLASRGKLKVTITVTSHSTGGGTKVVAHKTVTFRPRHRHH